MAKKYEIGLFGKIYSEYSRKGQEAVDFLVKKKQGEVPNALYHKDIGWIDLVWGQTGTAKSDGYGLSKIVKYHPKVIKNLATNIKDMILISKSKNRYVLESDSIRAVVSRVWFDKQKTWCLTVYQKI